MDDALYNACEVGDVEAVIRLLDGGKNVDTFDSMNMTSIMFALWHGHLHVAIMLVGRGADLSRVSSYEANMLHYAAEGANRQCIEWVLANTTIDINSTTHLGTTPIIIALNTNQLDAAKLLVKKGANLFIKNNDCISGMSHGMGHQVLQHAEDLIWESVKPLLLLSKACSTSTPSSSLIKLFSISGLVRDYIAPYVMRKGPIIRDPEEDVDEEPEADEVKLRIEAALAAASSSSSSSNSSSSNISSIKRAREE
jgi:ankyrin repeat protein